MTITTDHDTATTDNHSTIVAVGSIPAWATEHEPCGEGFTFTRESQTLVTDGVDVNLTASALQLQQSTFLDTPNGRIVASTDQPTITDFPEGVTIDGARDFIRALTELIEAYDAHA